MSSPPIVLKETDKEHITYFPNQHIGEGGQGDVYKGIYKKDGKKIKCAIKKIENFNEKNKEIEHLKTLKHGNIVQYYDSVEVIETQKDGKKIKYAYIALELFDGSMNSLVEREKYGEEIRKNLNYTNKLDEKFKILKQIVDGVSYLHDNAIIHFDFKPCNILVKKNEKSDKAQYPIRAAIADFGLSKRINHASCVNMSQFRGTKKYAAPEVKTDSTAKRSADIYSLGWTFYDFLSDNKYIEEEPRFQLHKFYIDDSPKCYDLIKSMVNPKNPDERPKSTDLVNHEIFEYMNKQNSEISFAEIDQESKYALSKSYLSDDISTYSKSEHTIINSMDEHTNTNANSENLMKHELINQIVNEILAKKLQEINDERELEKRELEKRFEERLKKLEAGLQITPEKQKFESENVKSELETDHSSSKMNIKSVLKASGEYNNPVRSNVTHQTLSSVNESDAEAHPRRVIFNDNVTKKYYNREQESVTPVPRGRYLCDDGNEYKYDANCRWHGPNGRFCVEPNPIKFLGNY